MRLSEKTIELNFCSQFAQASRSLVLWFGLTQRQEAQAGFDVCTRVRGRLLLLQFKASDYILRSGHRRFYLHHDQLTNLQARVKGYQRSVFYVFPMVGSTLELSHNANVLGQSWFLDIAQLPIIAWPTTRTGKSRKSGIHYADIAPPTATIHSEPIDVGLIPASVYASQGFPGADGVNWAFESFDDFWEFRRYLLRSSVAVIIASVGQELNAL
jgi:hypothetical protein